MENRPWIVENDLHVRWEGKFLRWMIKKKRERVEDLFVSRENEKKIYT